MKKIWYLKDIRSDNTKAVKVFLYEKNGLPAGKLDLSAFREDSGNKDIVLTFQGDNGKEIGSVELPKQMAARDAYLQGKGQLRADLAKSLAGENGGIQLSAAVGEKTYLSEGWLKESVAREDAEREDGEREGTGREDTTWQEAEKGEEERGVKGGQSVKTSAVGEELQGGMIDFREGVREHPADIRKRPLTESTEEVKENVTELEAEEFLPEESGGKRFVQLATLEEELEFRKFVHNSFLLHGYYNYGHVVIDESGEGARLGVPGNYYKREQMVAEMFGFPNFEAAKEKEQVVNGTFGYYFTPENR